MTTQITVNDQTIEEWIGDMLQAYADLQAQITGLDGRVRALETAPPVDPPPPEPVPAPPAGLWLSPEEIMALPMSGEAWDNVLAAAQEDTGTPDLANQDSKVDVWVLAKALVYGRTGEIAYRDEVEAALFSVQGTEAGASILSVCRGLYPYVIAADLIDYRDAAFDAWLVMMRQVVFSGAGPALSVVGCQEKRPNNFGTHASASRIAIALYLEDVFELERAITVFQGYLGNRDAYAGFSYGTLDWQADPAKPVGINPAGATKDGHSIDGVQPDDQRRTAGGFQWPPPKQNYCWEALQGACVAAQLLHRAGYPAWEWSDRALLRAVKWLHEEADYPADGDDTPTPWLVNAAYGESFPAVTPTQASKGMGFTDWSHAGGEG